MSITNQLGFSAQLRKFRGNFELNLFATAKKYKVPDQNPLQSATDPSKFYFNRRLWRNAKYRILNAVHLMFT